MKYVNVMAVSVGSVAAFAGFYGIPMNKYILITLGLSVTVLGVISLVASDGK